METKTLSIKKPECLKGKLSFGDREQIDALRYIRSELNRDYKVFRYEREISITEGGTIIAENAELLDVYDVDLDALNLSTSDVHVVSWDCEEDPYTKVEVVLV